jgi:hypothetical protein
MNKTCIHSDILFQLKFNYTPIDESKDITVDKASTFETLNENENIIDVIKKFYNQSPHILEDKPQNFYFCQDCYLNNYDYNENNISPR